MNDEMPEDPDTHLSVSSVSDTAGGWVAVLNSTQLSVQQVGISGALSVLKNVNQKSGFDCPGCAWPDPDHRSIAEFCENGAKAVADEATQMRVTPAFFQKHSVSDLLSKTDRWLNSRGRLTQPLFLDNGSENYEEISWNDAFDLVADTLATLDDPNEAIFYTSGRTSNEAAFAYQLLVRAFGTNNLPDCSNMCHESSGVGLSESIGIGKGTVRLEDFDKADMIFVVGQNPGTNHPRMLTALQSAVRKGAHVVSVNPMFETGLRAFAHPQELRGMLGAGTPLAATHLPVKINGDVALFKGIMKALLEIPNAIDHAFIEEQTVGFDALKQDLEETSWEEIVEHSGVSRDQIDEVATRYAAARSTIVCWAMGITQHVNGVANVQTLVNFLLLRGNIGRPGAGACPVRGHSNVQGDRTVGIVERPKPAFIERLNRHFDIDAPIDHGFDTVNAIVAMHEKRARFFFGMGGNFVSASPDTSYTARALRNCDLTVHVSTKLNRSHLTHGARALILPCLGRTEFDEQEGAAQFVTVENSMGIVHTSSGDRTPASEHLKSEIDIVCSIGQRVAPGIDWEAMRTNYDTIRSHIEACVPGFEQYNERVREPGGFELPNGPRHGEFTTSDQKAHFFVHDIPTYDLKPGEFLMSTVRSHDQFNTTVYTDNDRYRGIKNGRRVVLMHRDDIASLGLSTSDLVELRSHYDDIRTVKNFRVVPYDVPRGSAMTYFPETNPLVPIDLFAEKSHTPASKSVRITIHRQDES